MLDNIKNYRGEIFDSFTAESLELNESVNFNNCIFKGDFLLKDIKSNKRIGFYDCEFSLNSTITSCEFELIAIYDCKFGDESESNFNIEKSKTQALHVKNLNGNRFRLNIESPEVKIEKCSLASLILKDVNSIYTHIGAIIKLYENVVNKLDINSNVSYSEFTFINGGYEWIIFEGEYRGGVGFDKKIKVNYLIFESCNFYKRIDIKEGNYNYVYFYRTYFQGLIWISGYDILNEKPIDVFIKEISFHESTFDKNITIFTSTLQNLTLSNNNFKQALNFNPYTKISDRKNSINVAIDGVNQGNILFENINAFINISGINFGNINFRNFSAHNLIIDNFQNKGIVSFSNIIDTELLVISNSIVGNTEFTGTDIDLFKEVIITDSNLAGINFSNHPFKIRSSTSDPKYGYGISDKTKWNSNLKTVFHQLKKASANKGDTDASIKYQALEYKYLKREKRFLSFDKVLLSLNQISNNFGQSWSRGVFFTLFTGLLFFKIYTLVNGLNYENNLFWSNYIIYISSFPKLELENVPDTINWQSSLVVWLSRIFISYGIFQTISAFRKYGKISKG